MSRLLAQAKLATEAVKRRKATRIDREAAIMTWALCLNCGDVKFGAICPCPKCGVASTGDMNLDIAFSDHHISQASLEALGSVYKAIGHVCSDDETRFWTFLHHISESHPEILSIKLEPEKESKIVGLLEEIELPEVDIKAPSQLRPSKHPFLSCLIIVVILSLGAWLLKTLL